MARFAVSRIVRLLALSFALSLETVAPARADGPVTACGSELKGYNYLTGDLDCSASPGTTLTLLAGATLDLRGFTLSEAVPDGTRAAVECIRRCTVIGPGTIVGATDNQFSAVVGGGSDWPRSRVTVDGATLRGGGIGVAAPRVNLFNATITENFGTGIWTAFSRIEGSTISANGLSPEAMVPFGIFGMAKTRIFGSTITGNGMIGVQADKIALRDSTVTDNDAAASCATSTCADLMSMNLPRVRDSNCGRSYIEGSDPAISWEVCSED